MDDLRIFNSMMGKKEAFKSDTGKVGVYTCGITPYDVTHIGHAFTYIFFDVVVRYLRCLGYSVTYAQNLTDIDDDIVKKSNQEGKNWRRLAEENTQVFLKDMRWLNTFQPDCFPRASDHITDIINLVLRLQDRGHSYERHGNVYFHVDTDKAYGSLSKLSREEMLPIANERGNNPKDPNKKDPLDFILWQARKPGEPSWPSPWGEGRPGWHIECSAMSMKYLGKTIDIHGGGADLIFPHHESSLAQARCATGKPFVRYWMHTGMVHYKGEKMSKSLGNLVLLSDLRKRYSPNVVRLCSLSHHHRSVCDFTDEELRQAEDINGLLKKVWLAQSGTGKPLEISEYKQDFFTAMNDDFNTPMAIDVLKNLATHGLRKPALDISNTKAFLNTAFNVLGLVMEFE